MNDPYSPFEELYTVRCIHCAGVKLVPEARMGESQYIIDWCPKCNRRVKRVKTIGG